MNESTREEENILLIYLHVGIRESATTTTRTTSAMVRRVQSTFHQIVSTPVLTLYPQAFVGVGLQEDHMDDGALVCNTTIYDTYRHIHIPLAIVYKV